MNKIYVWDLPTRLFHWTLLGLVVFQWASAEIGGDLMDYHLLTGYAIAALVVFRVAWGFAGNRYARFGNFLRGVGPTIEYARAMRAKTAPRYLGHNPLGGWMVLALLGTLAIQVTTGLFANDDVMTEGPLRHLVSDRASSLLTEVHGLVFNLLVALVALHVVAVYAHRIFKKEDLIRPMLTGYKQADDEDGEKQ
ncbi:MAG: cytochrome b/b6 domain-containing protein [Sulfuricella sp.]|jgi:cytochrome b|nr:cytochrome b/b6 domain-containing protein [Sulfuricella sp.]